MLAAMLAVRARRCTTARTAFGPRWAVAIGTALMAFGAVYPHFLDARPLWVYAVAAPFGLVPCPSLAVVLGAALVAGRCDDRVGSSILAVAGALYALFGMLRLEVWLDAPLLVGALALGRRALHPQAVPAKPCPPTPGVEGRRITLFRSVGARGPSTAHAERRERHWGR